MNELFIILNLILIESLLSIDNAAVLAAMVQDLPKEQRKKALQYGILGAYALRGVCLLFATWLVKILWLKIAGGLYLLWLTYSFFKKAGAGEEQDTVEKEGNVIFKKLKGVFGLFWTTVILVELMDLTFSIDNIFACVAFTNNFFLICVGVFIGILAMRFVAQSFIQILEKYPWLEKITFIVIGILGIKLILSGICDYIPGTMLGEILNSHTTDVLFSIGILLVFLVPVLIAKFKKA